MLIQQSLLCSEATYNIEILNGFSILNQGPINRFATAGNIKFNCHIQWKWTHSMICVLLIIKGFWGIRDIYIWLIRILNQVDLIHPTYVEWYRKNKNY